MLVFSLGLWAFSAGAQTVDMGADTPGYRRFMLYPHLEKGLKAMAQGDRSRALAEFEQARQLAPNNPMVAMHLAEAYRRFGEPARAEAVLNSLRPRPPAAPSRPAVSAAPVVPLALIAEETLSAPSVERSAALAMRKASQATAGPVRGAERARKRGVAQAAKRPGKAGAAYEWADRAYKTSARGDHEGAARAARHALDLAPDNLAYRSLLVYELTLTDQFEAADAVASQAMAGTAASELDAELDAELAARQKLVRQHIAFKYFEATNKAAAAGQTEAALAFARQAVDYAPDLMPYRLQLVGLLLGAQKWPEAEQAASEAIRETGSQPDLLMLRAHALQHSNQGTMASGLGRSPTVQTARRRAEPVALPKVACVSHGFFPWCDVLPAEAQPDPAYAAADEAYKALGVQNHEVALSKAREAVQESPDNPQFRVLLVKALLANGDLAQTEQEASDFLSTAADDGEMLALRSRVRYRMGTPALAMVDAEAALRGNHLSVSSEIDLLLQLNRKQQARERLAVALRDGELASLPDVEVAYLAVRVGDDAAALAAFDRAASKQALPNTALQDAAYAASRLGRNEASVAYFKQAIDASDSGQTPLAPQPLFNVRRSVADQTRKGGVYGSVTYRGIAASGLSLTPGASNDTVQAGLEAYWRPLGYGDGRLLELYGGLSGTLSSDIGLSTGTSSVQGALGARVKPLADANLVLALERRLKMGSSTQDDWLARIGYSWDRGLDLRVDQPDWWTAQVYAEAGRFIELKQTYATFEGQAGRSFRMDQTSPKLVVFPHLVLGADRNTGYAPGHENAVGAGVGVSLRYWFNEDHYTAPRSYLDASLQYRDQISGDERAKGVFFRLTLSF
jgi:adsorption protein A